MAETWFKQPPVQTGCLCCILTVYWIYFGAATAAHRDVPSSGLKARCLFRIFEQGFLPGFQKGWRSKVSKKGFWACWEVPRNRSQFWTWNRSVKIFRLQLFAAFDYLEICVFLSLQFSRRNLADFPREWISPTGQGDDAPNLAWGIRSSENKPHFSAMVFRIPKSRLYLESRVDRPRGILIYYICIS